MCSSNRLHPFFEVERRRLSTRASMEINDVSRQGGRPSFPVVNIPRLSPSPNQKSNFKSNSRFKIENRVVQYRRDRCSPNANYRLQREKVQLDKTEEGAGSASAVQIRGISSVSMKGSDKTLNENAMCWIPVPQLQIEPNLEEPKDTLLHSNRQLNEKRPEDHPLYAAEWNSFWERRQQRSKLNGKNSSSEDFMPDWIKYWNNRVNDLDVEAEIKESTQFQGKRKFQKDDSYVRKGHNSEYGNGSWGTREVVGKRSLHKSPDHKKNLDLVHNTSTNPFPHNRINGIQPTLKESPSKSLRDSLNPKRICQVNPSQTLKDRRLFCKQNLLEILRMLVALEDCLGSLGPGIINLLTRALSAERCEIGSSSKLMIEDPTCVDLLDTSKEKLKGLLLSGILVGVQRTAALQAVKYVTSLFKQFGLGNNLQNAGLEHSFQSTSKPLSVITSSSVVVVKDKDSTAIVNNSDDSRFEINDRFSGEELKTLIVNFRTLTSSQKRDLVKYLYQLEETFEENETNPIEEMCSTFSSTNSPLSKKYGRYENGKFINPTAPGHPSLRIRFPFISKKTGLSSIDLDNFGIPLDELDSHCYNKVKLDLNRNLPCPKSKEMVLPPTVNDLCPSGIYRFHLNNSEFCQSSQTAENPLLRDAQSSCQINVINQDDIQEGRQDLELVHLQSLSFYYEKLDPRKNRILRNGIHVAQHRPILGSQINSQCYEEPVRIPTSPTKH